MAYRLEQEESLATGLDRLVREQAKEAAGHLSTSDDDLARAVHEARKRSKEARAALRLLRGSLGDEAARAARTALRDAARRIAPARDAEASLAALEKLRHAQRLLRQEHLPAESALKERRDAARGALSAAAVADVAAAFAAAADDLPAVRYALAGNVAAALARIHRRGGDAMRAARESGSEEDHHRWRHEAKDLWYAVRLFEPTWAGPLGVLADELRVVSQLLGDEHDLSVLRATLATSGGDPPLLTPRIARAIDRRQRKLRSQAYDLGERLWAERPRAFAARLTSYWQAWSRPDGRDWSITPS
jgi:CHAD domain-containing protein